MTLSRGRQPVWLADWWPFIVWVPSIVAIFAVTWEGFEPMKPSCMSVIRFVHSLLFTWSHLRVADIACPLRGRGGGALRAACRPHHSGPMPIKRAFLA